MLMVLILQPEYDGIEVYLPPPFPLQLTVVVLSGMRMFLTSWKLPAGSGVGLGGLSQEPWAVSWPLRRE